MLGRGLANLMVGPISDGLKARFKEAVDTRDNVKDPINVGSLLEAWFRLHKQQSTALTRLTIDQGDTIEVSLTRESNGDWKITGVDGKVIREAMRESADSATNESDKPSSGQP
jgi:hypothetical protein